MTSGLRLRWLQRGLLALGILLLGLWYKSDLESRVFQSVESNKLEAALRQAESGRSENTASNAAFIGPSASRTLALQPAPGAALGRIEIPRLRITAIIAEGADVKTLRHAVGHIRSTALPGGPGNCGLAGHRDTFLRGLGRVRANDVIRIVTPERRYTYEVESCEVVEPRRVDVLDSTATRSLTLVTCYPFVFVGHAPKRFVVHARQINAVAVSGTTAKRGEVRPQGLTAARR
jgi:sortase A